MGHLREHHVTHFSGAIFVPGMMPKPHRQKPRTKNPPSGGKDRTNQLVVKLPDSSMDCEEDGLGIRESYIELSLTVRQGHV